MYRLSVKIIQLLTFFCDYISFLDSNFSSTYSTSDNEPSDTKIEMICFQGNKYIDIYKTLFNISTIIAQPFSP